jgi:hypothetical protein
MNSSLDLNLLPLARQGGNDKTDLPDMYAVTPPRRCARGRETESLIIYLSLTGNSPLSPEAHAQLLQQLARKFYDTAGSLTSALRTVAEALNQYLLDRNLRSTGVGRQGIGQLILVALRPDTLYLAQCGNVHVFLLTPQETQDLYDQQSSGRGLGLSRTTPMRFLQTKMDPDDYLVLATQSTPGWESAPLKHPKSNGIDALRRQLVEDGSQDFNAVIVQAQAGTGKLKLLKRKTEVPAIALASTGIQPVQAETFGQPTEDKRLGIPSSSTATIGTSGQYTEDKKLGIPTISPASMTSSTGEVQKSATGESGAVPFPTQTTNQPADVYESGPSQQGQSATEAGIPKGTSTKSGRDQADPNKANPALRTLPFAKYFTSIRRILAAVGAAILLTLRNVMATLSRALLRLLKSLLPDADVLRLPPSAMVFIALAIPLVLATIGGMVYLQRGRAQQQEVFLKKAVENAAYAATLTNPLEQHLAWQTVLGDLDKAEYYKSTSETQALRATAIESLDALDAVKRLDYQQAIVGGLDASVRVTQMVATAYDLYMLDAEQGSVLHAILTGRGFEIDPNFQCGPTFGPVDVGPLVDIAELPPGSFENASLLAMDANGNLLYCVIGSQPYSAAMAPPNTGFGVPTAMTLDESDLYILDPQVNAVWIYRNLEVSQQPRLFFGDDIPPMEDVIDLAAYNDDLYLLHADGHITKCTYSGLAESPTRCDDPYSFSDNRPGKVHGPFIEDTVFSQIYFLTFPERSIYLLDPQNQAIYYFSVLLNLQCQYQPKAPIAEGDATAFTISPNRTAFLAIRNYVYYVAMP